MIKGKKLLASLRAAHKGLLLVFDREQNFRIHTICGVFALVFALVLKIPSTDFLILCITIVFVLACEVINTGMEHFLDVIKPRVAPAVRDIKDMMAGLVLLSAILSLLVGIGIFLPPLTAMVSPLFQ